MRSRVSGPSSPVARSRSPRIAGAIRVVVIGLGVLLTACQSAVSPSPSASGPIAPGPSAGGPDQSTAPASPVLPTIDLGASTYHPAKARNGGTLVIGDDTEANVFQPYFATKRADRTVAAAAWSPLVTLAPDGRYVPVLAATVPTTANGAVRVPGAGGDAMTVTWRLRDGLRWSDGEPLGCDDVKYTWQWLTDPDNVGVDPTGFEDISSVECRSATDMVWHFQRTYGAFLSLVVTPLPRHALAPIPMSDQVSGIGFRPADLPKLPVSGPFRFASATPGGELKMTANPNWLDPLTGAKAHLAGITWHWFAAPAAAIAAFRAGTLDVVTGVEGTDLAAAKGLEERVSAAPSLAYESLVLNWSRGAGSEPGGDSGGGCARGVLVASRGRGCPVADEAIRTAIARTIGKQAIVDEVLGGAATPVDDAVPAEAWFAAPLSPAELDANVAREALDAAGWRPGPDGIRLKDGLLARIEVCTPDDPRSAAIITRIAAQLQAVGIEAVANPVPVDQLEADPATTGADVPCVLGRGAFDAALMERTSPVDPLGYFFAFHSSQITPDGSNIASIDDPEIDAALETVAGSADPDAIRTAIAAFERQARDRVVEVPLFRPRLVDLVASKVGNVVPNALQDVPTWNVGDWFRSR